MQKIRLRKPLAIIIAIITIVSLITPAALAADNTRSVTMTDITDVGRVTITNNFNARSSIELKLPAKAAVNTVFKVYSSETVLDKTTQLGTLTVRKNNDTGTMALATGKLFSYAPGSVFLVKDGTLTALKANYAQVGETAITVDGSTVRARNVVTGAELLIINKTVLMQDMTVFAIVNGKMYRGTVKDTTRDFQLPLARDLESGTRIWYALAAPGCREMEYSMLTLGDVVTSADPNVDNIRVFYQGEGVRTSSLNVTGLDEGDMVRYYAASAGGTAIKTATVAKGGYIANLTGLTLSPGTIYLTVTKKGDRESARIAVPVPAATASASLKTTSVVPLNVIGGSVITVSGVAETDEVIFYSIEGTVIDYTGETDFVYNNVNYKRFDGLDLGQAATKIFASVLSVGKSESAWTQITVKAALERADAGFASLEEKSDTEVTLFIDSVAAGSTIQLFRDEYAMNSMGTPYRFVAQKSDDATVDFEKDLAISALKSALGVTDNEDIVFYYTVTETGKHPSEPMEVVYTATGPVGP